MDRLALEESESRFAAFIGSLNEVIGHRDRIGPFRDYCAGLLAGCERKSVEPLAAITAPSRVSAQHQSFLHFVGDAPWSDAAVLSKVRELTLPVLEKRGPVEALIVDDTGFPKKGKRSVGVARQYCGQLGKLDNCQIAVSLSVANHHASLPIAYSLYLPQEWSNDPVRRAKAGVPGDVAFQTKPEIALAQIAQALQDGVPRGTVLMDAGYGVNTALRDGVTALGLSYVAGILPQTSVWRPGAGPLPPKPWTGQERPPSLMRRDGEHQPVSVKELALSLPASAFATIAWREGACEHSGRRKRGVLWSGSSGTIRPSTAAGSIWRNRSWLSFPASAWTAASPAWPVFRTRLRPGSNSVTPTTQRPIGASQLPMLASS